MKTQHFSFLCFFCIFLSFYSFTKATATTFPPTIERYANNQVGLKLLAKPQPGGQLLEIIAFATPLIVLEESKNGYAKVKTATQTGYVPQQFLQAKPPTPTALSKIFAPSKMLNAAGEVDGNYNPFQTTDFSDCPTLVDEMQELSTDYSLVNKFLGFIEYSGFFCPASPLSYALAEMPNQEKLVIDNDILLISQEFISFTRYTPNFNKPSPTPNSCWVFPKSVEIYAQNTANSKVVGTVLQGAMLTLTKKSSSETVIHKGIKGKFVQVTNGAIEGYVFDGYVSILPLPEDTDETKYVDFLQEKGYTTIFKSSFCDLGDCDAYTNGFPSQSPYHAFMLLKSLFPNSRLHAIEYDQLNDHYLLTLSPRKEMQHLLLPFDNLAIQNEGEDGLHVTWQNGILLIKHLPGDW